LCSCSFDFCIQYIGGPQGKQAMQRDIPDTRMLLPPPVREERRVMDSRVGIQQQQQQQSFVPVSRGNGSSSAPMMLHPSRSVQDRSAPFINAANTFEEATVSAFVCEKPVIVSVSRVRDLVNRLQGILIPHSTETPVIPELLPLVSDMHKSDTPSLLLQLKGLIDSVYIPPALPSVLFGK